MLLAAARTVRMESAAEPPLRMVAVASPFRPPTVMLLLLSERKALEPEPKAMTFDVAPSAATLPTMISPALRLTPPVKEFALLMVSVPVPFLAKLVEPAMPLLPCSM